MAEPFEGLFDSPVTSAQPFDNLFDDAKPRFSEEQRAAEQLRQETGKRKQFDAEFSPVGSPADPQYWKDVAAPFYDPDARRQIKDPNLGGAASAAAAMESIPVAITNLGTTPVDENPNASTAARLSQDVGGGLMRAGLTAPLGPVMLGAGEALAKSNEIATNEPMANIDNRAGTFARVATAGLVPGAASKVAGAVVPRVAEAAPAAVKWLAGTAAGTGVELAGNEVQKGVEYLGTGNEPKTLEGFGQSLVPTPEDLITLAPGVVGSGVQARRAIAGLPQAKPQVLDRTDIRDTPLDPYSYSARAEGIMNAEREVMDEMPFAEAYDVPLLEYSGPRVGREIDYGPMRTPDAPALLEWDSAPDAEPIKPLAGAVYREKPMTRENRESRRADLEAGMLNEYPSIDAIVKEAKAKGIVGRKAIEAQWPFLTRDEAKFVRERAHGRTYGPTASYLDENPDFTPPPNAEAQQPYPSINRQPSREDALRLGRGDPASYRPNFVEGVGRYPDIPRPGYELPPQPEGQVKPTPNEQPQQLPTGQERSGDPSSPELGPTQAQGTGEFPADSRYAGGLNKRLFGMDKELEKHYEAVAEEVGPTPRGMTREQVREAAATAAPFTSDELAKIKDFDVARELTPVDRAVISRQRRTLADKAVREGLNEVEQATERELHRVAKIVRGQPGSDLALLDQEVMSDLISEGNYKAAALEALKQVAPDGVVPEKAIKAIREGVSDPLTMARTVFRESRRNHGFLQSFITANLLSNVFGTVPVNMFSNIVNLAARTVARKPSDVGTAIAGADRGIRDAASRAAFVGKEGFTMEALQNPSLAAKAQGFAAGGRLNPFNWGGRAAFAGDEFIKGMAEQSHIDVLAKAKALEMAGGDKAKAAEIAKQLSDSPTPEMLKEAKEFGKNVSYQMEPDEATGMLSRFINWAPVGKGTRAEIKPIKVAVPFFNTVMNVAKANVALSPAGALAGAVQGARGKITPGQAATQVAMGLIPTAIGVGLAERGMITGPIPDDPGEREAFFEAGKKPWTIQVGNKQIPLAWAGPFALSLGLGAALKEAKRQSANGKIPDDLASIGLAAGGNAFELFMEGSPLISLNSLMEAVAKPSERNLKKLATNVGSSVTPLVSLQGFMNRQNIIPALRDEVLRDKSGQPALEEVLNGIVDRTMLARKVLPERVSSLGTTLDRPGQITQSPPDPVFSELYRLGVDVPQASRNLPKLPGAAKAEEATPEEYRSVLRSGQPIYDLLRQHMATPEWAALPDDQRRLIIERAFGAKGLDRYRDVARKRALAGRLAGAAN